jgi:hypothetical protein
MVFNTTFNNISVISWWSVLLVEETGGPGENHQPVASHGQTLSHNVVHLALIKIQTHNMSGVLIIHLLKGWMSRIYTKIRKIRSVVKYKLVSESNCCML